MPVRRFLPSRDGFAFTNSWPDEPAIRVRTPFGELRVGHASAGLCGGMVFAALDYWLTGNPAPETQPAGGSTAYRFLVRRIIASWRLPFGVLRYYAWMLRSDADVIERTLHSQWPRVKADLDRGRPCALGVVTIRSRKPSDLRHNHQVLAYRYDLDDTGRVTLRVYDPNSGRHDDVWIGFGPELTSVRTEFTSNIALSRPVRGFFRTRYRVAGPPSAQEPATGQKPVTTR